jgi:hypothetical protein
MCVHGSGQVGYGPSLPTCAVNQVGTYMSRVKR